MILKAEKEKIRDLLIVTFYLVLGVLFCALLHSMVDFLETALCIILMLFGTVLVVYYCLMNSEIKQHKILLFGTVCILLGLCIMFLQKFFVVVLSILIASGGIFSIINALKIKKQQTNGWLVEFIIGIIVCALALAVAIISGTTVGRNILAIILGVDCLIEGIFRLVEFVKLIKQKPEEENIKD